ncbi:MAG: hypothetical protein EOM25_05145, partial [Deltaproteobacteria bacterium]|nr:hypothetical protein [Deltaproteobacteria bacterium]
MKRILLLAIAAAFVFASVLPASAVELNARGQFKTQFSWWHNAGTSLNFDNDVSQESFTAQERARLWFDFIANENLKGVYAVEVGTFHWGDPAAGAATGARKAQIETLEAYIDFTLEALMGLNIKAGLQYFM